MKRSLIAIAGSLVFVTLLFWVMQFLVLGRDKALPERENLDYVDFVRVKRDTTTETRSRVKPPPPPPPKNPPPPQKLEVQNQTTTESPTPMDIPNLGLTPGVTGGPFIGQMAAGGGGGGAGLFDGDIIPLARVAPMYPRNAARDGVEGKVLLELIVNPDGTVREAKVIESKPRGIFDAAAKQAVMKWKFKPRVVNGQPVAQKGTLPMEFTLGE